LGAEHAVSGAKAALSRFVKRNLIEVFSFRRWAEAIVHRNSARAAPSASASLRPAAALRASTSNLAADGQVVELGFLSVGSSN